MYVFGQEIDPNLTVYRDEIAGFDAVDFVIGADEDDACEYRMRIRLNDATSFGPENEKVRQLWYGPIGVNEVDKKLMHGMIFTTEAVVRFIPKEHRRDVLINVCRSITLLASSVRPPFIERATAEAKLPLRALAKYFFTSEALTLAGYRLLEATETKEGNGYWLHERNDAPS